MLIPLAFAALLAFAPSAVQADDQSQPACPDGQVETPEGCSQQAWVDDCPPDMLCAAGGPEPIAYGNDTCIECSGVADPEPQTCMDGAQAGEACDDDVQYFGPGPADSGMDGEPAQADTVAGESKDKDAPLVALLVAVVGLVLLARRI